MAIAAAAFAAGSVAAGAVLWLFATAVPGPDTATRDDGTAAAGVPAPQRRPAQLAQIAPAAGAESGTAVPYVEGVPLPELRRLDAQRQRQAAPSLAVTPPPPKGGQVPPWRRYAAVAPAADGKPMIAIVLDDVGLSQFRSDRVIALPRPVTLAVLPYGVNLQGLVARARAAGHEILVHMPMEPTDASVDPGPSALLTGLDAAELERRLRHNLDGLSGYVGTNNHMGSRLTASVPAMEVVMRVLHERGLLFLDSLTTGRSVAGRTAARHGVPALSRDIFIDAERDPAFILEQLDRAARLARQNGYAIAIGHPYPETLRALEAWLPLLADQGLRQVSISAIVAARVAG